jgi:hypothetical protein
MRSIHLICRYKFLKLITKINLCNGENGERERERERESRRRMIVASRKPRVNGG